MHSQEDGGKKLQMSMEHSSVACWAVSRPATSQNIVGSLCLHGRVKPAKKHTLADTHLSARAHTHTPLGECPHAN